MTKKLIIKINDDKTFLYCIVFRKTSRIIFPSLADISVLTD